MAKIEQIVKNEININFIIHLVEKPLSWKLNILIILNEFISPISKLRCKEIFTLRQQSASTRLMIQILHGGY